MSGYLGNNIYAEIVVDIDIPSSSSSTNTEETTLPESADESCLALVSNRRSPTEKTVDNTHSHIKRQHHNTAINVQTTGTTEPAMSSIQMDDVTQPSCSRDIIEDEETNNDTSGKISPEETAAKMTDTVLKTNGNKETGAIKSPKRETMVPPTINEHDQLEEDNCCLDFLYVATECCKCNIM